MKKKCKICGNNKTSNYYNRICQKCFSQRIEKTLISNGEKLDFKSNFMIEEYLIQNKPIRKIAREQNTTVFKVRSHLEKYKIPIVRKTNTFDEDVFSKMTSQSAFLLGYIFTDGDFLLNKTTNKYFLRIYSIHNVQIEKLKKILKTNAKTQVREQKNYGSVIQSKIFFIHIGNQKIICDLLKIGLTIKKNKNVKFPKIETKFIHHFIRGCWAGSGNVTIYKNKIFSSITIGSLDFITELEFILSKNGLKKRNIYPNKQSKRPSYLIKYANFESEKLYNYLYKGKKELTISEKQESIYKKHFKRKNCNQN